MVTKKKARAKQTPKRLDVMKATKNKAETANAAAFDIPEQAGKFLRDTSIPKGFDNPKPIVLAELQKRVTEMNLRPTVSLEQFLASANRIKPADLPIEELSDDVKESIPH